MRFGLNFFPSFRPQDSTTADYYEQCLRIAERADVLDYSSTKTDEIDGGHISERREAIEDGIGMNRRMRKDASSMKEGKYWNRSEVKLKPRVVKQPDPPSSNAAL